MFRDTSRPSSDSWSRVLWHSIRPTTSAFLRACKQLQSQRHPNRVRGCTPFSCSGSAQSMVSTRCLRTSRRRSSHPWVILSTATPTPGLCSGKISRKSSRRRGLSLQSAGMRFSDQRSHPATKERCTIWFNVKLSPPQRELPAAERFAVPQRPSDCACSGSN